MIFDEFETGLESLENIVFDTESRERVCYYYQEIMVIIGVENSNELLNNWMF